MQKYVVLEKEVGETPLSCTERWRATEPGMVGVPLSYAGRLDPMASGKLIVLIGEECKNQTSYHGLDKEYEFSVLFGISSDTQDVLGRLTTEQIRTQIINDALVAVCLEFTGDITFPYPHFSAKTVQGKPLHMWTLEGRLGEIEIPVRTSTIYELELVGIETKPRQEIVATALKKINSIPEVTDPRKALGADFRRKDVRADWQDIATNFNLPSEFDIAYFRCISSSGAYMRTLATMIAQKMGVIGLAYHIHRTKIGHYDPKNKRWKQEF